MRRQRVQVVSKSRPSTLQSTIRANDHSRPAVFRPADSRASSRAVVFRKARSDRRVDRHHREGHPGFGPTHAVLPGYFGYRLPSLACHHSHASTILAVCGAAGNSDGRRFCPPIQRRGWRQTVGIAAVNSLSSRRMRRPATRRLRENGWAGKTGCPTKRGRSSPIA